MAIYINKSYEEAQALPEPKHIWLNSSKVIVYTGSDIPSSPRATSPYDFRQRFTDAEMDSIISSAFSGNVTVRKLLLKLQTTDVVDLDNTTVQTGMQYLVDQLIITSQRKTEILS